MKIHRSLYFTLFAMLLLVACSSSKPQDELAKNLPLLDSLAGNFQITPSYKTFHYAVEVTFDSGRYAIDTNVMYMRNGRLPYSDGSAGNMRLVAQDANGKEIGAYRMENPLYRRVCEGEKREVTKVESGKFELLLPGKEGLTSFQLLEEGKEIATLKVPDRILRTEIPNMDPKGDTLNNIGR